MFYGKFNFSIFELTKGVEPRRGEIGPVAVLNKYSMVK